jgi:hypothetical protein
MAGTVGDRYRGADNALPDSRSHDFTLPCCHVAPRATLLRATKEPNPHPTTPLAHSICLFYCSQINGEPDRAPQRATPRNQTNQTLPQGFFIIFFHFWLTFVSFIHREQQSRVLEDGQGEAHPCVGEWGQRNHQTGCQLIAGC